MPGLEARRGAGTSAAAGVLAGLLLLAAGAARAAAEVRGVILVSIDSLRADHLSLYGYPRETMPHLSRAARERGALVFSRATAVSPACHPSHTAILTGFYPQQVGVPGCGEDFLVGAADLELEERLAELEAYQEELRRQPPALARKRRSAVINWLRIPEGTETLATFLQERGYRTGGFVSIWTVEGRFGYGRGFDVFADEMPEYYGPPRLAWLLRDHLGSQRRRDGAAAVTRALEFLGELGPDEPFFVFLHLADTHVPYRAVPGLAFEESPAEAAAVRGAWAERYPEATLGPAMERMAAPRGDLLLDRYDRSLLYADAQLGRLFAALADRGLLDEALVVVTSDHGESFGQHRYLSAVQGWRLFFEHSVYVWEETQAVPLLIFDPKARDGLARRGANASHVDIAPTVLEALGLDPAAFADGSLPGRSLLASGDEPRTVFFLTFGRGRPGVLQRVLLDYPRFIGWRSGDLKFFVDRARFRDPVRGRCFLYDLAADPHELRNLCEAGGPEAEARAGKYRQILVDWYGSSVVGRRP